MASPLFVGGHPVCGSEASGPEHASADLFEGATWFLTPLATPIRPAIDSSMASSVRSARRRSRSGPTHTTASCALTSHLPHALANLVANQAGEERIDGHDPLAAAGGSLRDVTRVAGANPSIWVDIFLDNRSALLDALAAHRQGVERLESALSAADAGSIEAWIADAAGNRDRVLRPAYAADPQDLYRVRVHVPDEPGVLAAITQALGADRLNIEDFELHHLSPERGGVLGILVAGEAEAGRAARLLEEQGYGVVVSPVTAG